MFDIGIGLPLDHVLNLEPRRAQERCHLVRTENKEVNTHFPAPQLVQMNCLIANVERHKQNAAQAQNSSKLAKSPRHVASGNVDEGVEGRDSGPSFVGDFQLHHVALSELNTLNEATRLRDHLRGQVHTANLNTALVQISRNVSWAAAHVARRTDATHPAGKSVE